MDLSRRVYLIILSFVALWCSLILAAPLLQMYWGNTSPFALVIYRFFSRICHQLDDRSFHLGGHAWAVCIRCSAIYFSFFLGLCLFPAFKQLNDRTIPPIVSLVAASAPMLVDVGLNVIGIFQNTVLTRLFTGAVFGVTASFFIYPLLLDAITKLPTGFSFRKGELRHARKT